MTCVIVGRKPRVIEVAFKKKRKKKNIVGSFLKDSSTNEVLSNRFCDPKLTAWNTISEGIVVMSAFSETGDENKEVKIR